MMKSTTTHGISVTSNGTFTVTYPWGESTYTKEFRIYDHTIDFIWNVSHDHETFEAFKGAIEEMMNPTTKIPASLTEALSTLNMFRAMDLGVGNLKSTKKYKEQVAYADNLGLILDFDKEQVEVKVTRKRQE